MRFEERVQVPVGVDDAWAFLWQTERLAACLPGCTEAVEVSAGERYTAVGSQLDRSTTPRQFELARETALEGLYYVRAARTAMGIDPGPELPAVAAQQGVGQITQVRELDVAGHTYRASPDAGEGTPYYYPGGHYQGRPVPAGWYSTPWWKTALGAGVGVVGGMLIADALFSPAFADPGYGYAEGYQEGFSDGQGFDGGGQEYFTGDTSFDDGGGWGGGDFGGGDWGGDFGGGDFGGGDW